MRVEILFIPDCSNSAEAAEVPCAVSPTILLDRIDAFPGDGRTSELACRICRTGTGFAGVPPVEDLIAAIRQRSESGT